MAADLPPRLVATLVFFLVVQVTLAASVPKLLPIARGTRSDAKDEEEAKQTFSGTDQTPVVTKTEATDGEEPVFIEFSFVDENKNEQREKNDHRSRYSYNIIDAPRVNAQELINVVGESDRENQGIIKDTEKKQETEEEDDGPLLQLDARRQIEFEKNLPGFANWPKHIPDHLRPISAFPEAEEVRAEEKSLISERPNKRSDAFLPSERLRPPSRAGPRLYAESIVDREFRIPVY